MADTARDEEDEKEYFDSSEHIEAKVTQLAHLIQKSTHFVAFTGAGISTSCGISDFRSGIDTVLDVGAGVWAKEAAQQKGIDVKKPTKQVRMLSALPSDTHMSLIQLSNRNLLKFIISQNVDGLHRRSGIPSHKLSELHGNTNLEVCSKCNHYFLKDYHVRTSLIVDEHQTGRICNVTDCGGALLDTIVNFGESLPIHELKKAQQNTKQGDLCLVLGSSLTVSPACDLAKHFGEHKKKHLCIVNLQKTAQDHLCTVRIFAKCDDVMRLSMRKLNLNIPLWKLTRYMRITLDIIQVKKECSFTVRGVEEDGTPSSWFTSVVIRIGDDKYFIGDPKWRDDEDTAIPKKQQLQLLEDTLKGLNKHLSRYAKMIYDAGFHTIDSLCEFHMDIACDVMINSNNYERRLIVEQYYKSILERPIGHDLKAFAAFEGVGIDGIIGSNNNEEEAKNDTEFSLEFEFAKHYDEPNLVVDLCKYIKDIHLTKKGINVFVFKMMYNPHPLQREWEVVLV
eukprot:341095_1